jgi:GT2 family glycosyltransferase
MPVHNTRTEWLTAALDSVRAQTYSRWELLCVDDASRAESVVRVLDAAASADPRIRPVRLETNQGVSAALNAGLRQATGDYVCFLDHDDALEPHALHRFASAIVLGRPDFLYSDELVCGADLDDVLRVALRPQFSYDYYLSHPYFVHLIGVRRTLALDVGFDETMPVSHDVDFVLRMLERASTVCHVPDVLYRWRTSSASLGHQTRARVDRLTEDAIRRHLARTGQTASIRPVRFNVRDVSFVPDPSAKVAVIVPTKNRAPLLDACLSSLARTVRPDTADVFVVDHESDDSNALRYLEQVRGLHDVVRYRGAFNFSAMMNAAIRHVPPGHTHYLFLNNDVEALEAGWLEHMLGLACRDDVAIVGACLLYPDGTIQHAGVVVGLMGIADHLGRFMTYRDGDGARAAGANEMLVCNRDVSAVTAACMLVKTSAFHEIGGFDERLRVGFGDTDLCLRAIKAGYRVLIDANAVLLHHEHATRGRPTGDPHPDDSRLFSSRWRALIRDGDPHYSPSLALQTYDMTLDPRARSTYAIRPRTMRLARLAHA